MTTTYPAGQITTPAPWGRPFGIAWSAISRWAADIDRAAGEYGVDPARVAAHVVIESAGKPDAMQINVSNGNSYGLTQIAVRWHGDLIRRLSGTTTTGEAALGKLLTSDPLLCLRCGCAILKDQYTRHKDWDKASSAFFLGNSDWRGADTVNGNTGQAYRTSLIGLTREIEAAEGLPVIPAPQPIPPTSGTPPSASLLVARAKLLIAREAIDEALALLQPAPTPTPTPTPKPAPIPPPTPARDPVFGRVPPPKNLTERIILNNTAWDDLGPRSIKGICLHRMLGTLVGTDGYFRGEASGRALTDFGVGAGGQVYQWNRVTQPVNGKHRSPWANGPASDVEGDGAAWIAKYGVTGVNRDCVSIEIEGLRYDAPFLDDPYATLGPETDILPCGFPVDLATDDADIGNGVADIGDADFARVCELVARLADLGRWRWDQWPNNPDGLHGLLSHSEFGPKACAGSAVLARVAEIIEVVGEMLKRYQVTS